MKFVISYSGGKDSALALHRMIQAGHEPVAMITTLNIQQGRSWFHGIQTELLDAISDRLGIPMIVCACKPDDYTTAIETGLKKGKALGAEAAVFGDIDIQSHKQWNEERCEAVDLECLLPLWQEDREALTKEGICVGFKAMIKIIQSDTLDASFLGRTLSFPLLSKMKERGVDICGENGEYHTIVYDGPIFKRPLNLEIGRTIDFGKHIAIDITFEK